MYVRCTADSQSNSQEIGTVFYEFDCKSLHYVLTKSPAGHTSCQ